MFTHLPPPRQKPKSKKRTRSLSTGTDIVQNSSNKVVLKKVANSRQSDTKTSQSTTTAPERIPVNTVIARSKSKMNKKKKHRATIAQLRESNRSKATERHLLGLIEVTENNASDQSVEISLTDSHQSLGDEKSGTRPVLGKPVIQSNSSILWEANPRTSIDGYAKEMISFQPA